MYRRCPRKYYLRYLLRLKQKPGIYLIRGTAVHESIARFHKLGIKEFNNPDRLKGVLLRLFDDTWLQYDEGLKQLGLKEATLNEFYRESCKMLSGWLRRYAAQEFSGKPMAEVKLFSRKYYVMGIVDAIQRQKGKAMLTDYKTSKSDEITPDIKVQMAIYALLYKENFNAMPDIVAVDFLKTRRERRFRVTPRFIQYALDLIRDIHRKTFSTQEKDYPCRCGGWCEKDFILENGGH